tara:strand:- start:379 stop:591 length:213 start_codon:yes stop_codon:yes gene_type:complete
VAVVAVVVTHLPIKPAKTAGLVAVAVLKTLDLQQLQAARERLVKATTAGQDIPGHPTMTKLAAVAAVLAQ